MSKSGCRHVKLLINSFAPQLHGQLQLPWTSDSNLQKHDSKTVDISGCRRLQELYISIYVAILAMMATFIFIESFDREHVRCHVGWQVLNLLRDGHVLSVLDFFQDCEVYEFDLINGHFLTKLNQRVFNPKIAINSTNMRHALKQ